MNRRVWQYTLGSTNPFQVVGAFSGVDNSADRLAVELPLINGSRYIGVVEHKSHQEAGTHYQMYGYVDACERMYAAHGKVIPIVYYHGHRPCKNPRRWMPPKCRVCDY